MDMLTPQQIRRIREALRLSYTELAVKVGVTENAARRWEIGDRRPRGGSLTMLYQLAEEAERRTGQRIIEPVPS